MRQLYIKQKVFSLSGKFTVKDQEEKDRFYVKGCGGDRSLGSVDGLLHLTGKRGGELSCFLFLCSLLVVPTII
jgi:uncharacterized protein YxjI